MYPKNDVNSSHPNTTWILVANGSEAKLYTALNKDLCPTNLQHIALTFIESFTHPQSREKSSELLTDQLGRYTNQSSSNSNSSFSEQTDPHDYEKNKFAQQLALFLDEKRKTDHLHSLILVCPSRFYGDLNKHLSKHLTNLVANVIEKDYTKEPELKLIQHLKNALSLP